MKTATAVMTKVENLYFDLQRKMMEFERMEMHSTDEEMEKIDYPFLMDKLNALQSRLGEYLEKKWNWDMNKATEKFYRSRWYQTFERTR